MRGSIDNWLNGTWDGNWASGTSGIVRRYLIEKADNECTKCQWKEIHPVTGKVPLELNHINGDPFDSRTENLEILCPNCHSLTVNYRNTGNTTSKRVRRGYEVSVIQAKRKRREENVKIERINFLISTKGERGWVAKACKEWGVSHTQVKRWAKRHFPEFHAFQA